MSLGYSAHSVCFAAHRSHRLHLALAIGVSLASASVVRALPPDAQLCQSRTAGGSRLVTYADQRQALWIVPGDTLCLRVVPGSGSTRIQIVPDDDGTTYGAALVVALEHDDARSVLRVHNRLSSPLRYRAAIAHPNAMVLRDTQVLPAAADAESTETWPELLPSLVLYDLELARVQPEVMPEHVAPRARNGYLGVSFVTGALRNSVGAINRELLARGFGTESDLQPIVGFAFDVAYDWFAASLDGLFGPKRAGGPNSPDVTQAIVALHAGLRPYWDQRFAVIAPMLGIAGGDVGIHTDPSRPPLSIEGLNRLPAQRVRRNLALLLGSIGAEYQVPLGTSGGSAIGLLFGLRAGYAWQLHAWSWVPDDPDKPNLHGGPDVNTSGPYLRLSIGLAITAR